MCQRSIRVKSFSNLRLRGGIDSHGAILHDSLAEWSPLHALLKCAKPTLCQVLHTIASHKARQTVSIMQKNCKIFIKSNSIYY